MNRTTLLLILPIGAALVSGASAQDARNVNGVQTFTFATKTPIDAKNLPPDPNPRVQRERYCLPRDLALVRVKDVKTSESNGPTKVNIDPDLQANCFQVSVEMPPPQSVCATVPRLSGLSVEETRTCQLVPTKVSFAVSYEAQKVNASPAVASTEPIPQRPSTEPIPQRPSTEPIPQRPCCDVAKGDWRASKLVGLSVYNDKNESIGSINDLITDKNGAIQAAIIGVGGFLGVGEHLVAVRFDQLKFSSEPVAYSTSDSGTKGPKTTSTTTGSASTSTPIYKPSRWYPDHAVLNATKDSLKAAPEFKYVD
jgi:sporulation protein YlmC with PRC-barrel domain